MFMSNNKVWLLVAILFFVVNAEQASIKLTSTKLEKVQPKPGAKFIVTPSNGLNARDKPCNGSKKKNKEKNN